MLLFIAVLLRWHARRPGFCNHTIPPAMHPPVTHLPISIMYSACMKESHSILKECASICGLFSSLGTCPPII
ncbi:hypothetical protein M432DRAFT_627910 [Thermoascus aurantiacus ATCC 26904]